MAGKSVREATSGDVPRADCMNVGTMMFMAKIVSSESMFTITPIANGRIVKGLRSISGSERMP